MNFDYIIVGQGIAGATLALALHKKGRSIMVIDETAAASCSRIAAGIYNPIVFKRLAKSWKADELIPFAEKFYTDAERILGQKLLHRKNIVKIFAEQQEINLWQKKSSDPGLQHYLEPAGAGKEAIRQVETPLGVARVKNGGHLDVAAYLDATRDLFVRNGQFLAAAFDHRDLEIKEEQVTYKDIKARYIIFCEGYRVLHNPLFGWLPFKLTKGELLTVEAPGLNLQEIVNKGVYVLPIGNDLYKIGATYEWEDLSTVPTEAGRLQLLEKLEKILKAGYRVVNHSAGIRPTVIDRRPIAGMHPQYKQVGILNGMGTKGVMAAPFIASVLVEHIENGRVLDTEISAARFFEHFNKA